MNKHVKIVEVSPRDGLQGEKTLLPTHVKNNFIHLLAKSGISMIEATSLVSPKLVPQMQDAKQVLLNLNNSILAQYSVLIPNIEGLEKLLQANINKVNHIAVLTSPSEDFNKHNLNCTIKQNLYNVEKIIALAKKNDLHIRAYISCATDNDITAESVVEIAQHLIQLGCYEIAISDSVGSATPLQVEFLLKKLLNIITADKLAVHFHNTYGQALVNIFIALQYGIRTIDSSVAGLGGCPFIPQASGNVATEDVIYLLHGLGYHTNIDMQMLLQAGKYICAQLNCPPQSSLSKIAIADYKKIKKNFL